MKILNRILIAVVLIFNLSSKVNASDLPIPRRPPGALGGKDLMILIKELPQDEREEYIFNELMKGNVPDFLRTLVPLTGTSVRVMSDYLAVGSNEDYVRISVSGLLANRIAAMWKLELPTSEIVDEVYKQAEIKLPPKPLHESDQMMSVEYLLEHEAIVNKQLCDLGYLPGQLIAGHKKDIISNEGWRPGRVVIYGWHVSDGHPIQPASDFHDEYYHDYSHGLRLLKRLN